MNRTIAIITVVCILTSLFLGIYFVQPKYQKLSDIKIEIQKKEKELQARKELLANLNELSKKLERYEEPISKISSSLPSHPSFPSLFNFLQKISKECGLTLESVGGVSTGPLRDSTVQDSNVQSSNQDSSIQDSNVPNPVVQQHSISLSLSGTYSSLKNFLSVLEKNSRIIEVKNISFSAPGEPLSPFSFGITIKTHSY